MRAPPALPTRLGDGGFKINVGLPGHSVRYVLPGDDLTKVGLLARRVVEPGSWFKVEAHPGVVAPLLPGWWSVQATEHLMHTALAAKAAVDVPADDHLSPATHAATAKATLTHRSGELAAAACVAVAGRFAVLDQMATAPAYRRKRRRSIVMSALQHHAAQQHATISVLVATDDGLGLYSKLGWALCTPHDGRGRGHAHGGGRGPGRRQRRQRLSAIARSRPPRGSPAWRPCRPAPNLRSTHNTERPS